MSAAFTRGWLQSVKVGVQPGVPRAVLLSRVLVAQGAVCWGRDSAAGQGKYSACLGISNSRVGRSCGWKINLQEGRVFLLLRGCFVDQGCSHLQITPKIFPRALFKGKVKARIAINISSFPEFVFSVYYSWDIFRRNRTTVVMLEQLTETPEL